MSHTLGPWVATNGMTNEYGIYGADEWPIFTIRDGLIPAREDARLLTAAPDMLDALQCALADLEGLAESLDEDHPAHQSIAECRAAIAKAEGAA